MSSFIQKSSNRDFWWLRVFAIRDITSLDGDVFFLTTDFSLDGVSWGGLFVLNRPYPSSWGVLLRKCFCVFMRADYSFLMDEVFRGDVRTLSSGF